MFKHIIARTPCRALVDGLSASNLGKPIYEKALEQHNTYIRALQTCGVDITILPPAEEFPDSVFVEDPALCTPHCAIVTRPGADSRRGEAALMEPVLKRFYEHVERIEAPGTLDAGDVMMVGSHYYIGNSARTNAEGARQLIAILEKYGMTGSVVEMDEVLHLKQEELFQRGHAIECRICAEDTENNFMPSPGVIKQLTEPNGIGVRIDSYVYDGYEIPIYYDPMIGKLIVWATTRQYAIERMRRVLYEYKITGVKTNLAYLKRIMHVPDFVKGEYNTLFIEKNARMLVRTNTANEELENIAMIAAYMDYLVNLEENVSAQLPDARPISRWREFGLQKGVLRI